MTTFLISMLVIVGVSCWMVSTAYITARDIVASGAGNAQTLEVVSRLKYALGFHILAILMLTVYIGIRLAQ